ncbi:nucleoprotein TPR-like [Artemia franciscana]|uniref:nucleoprotein TPR-like n=1 Tax=Artemia franciscana TaxID=6661 RepID=UPI0032DAE8BC
MAEFDQVQDLLTDSALKITELEEKMTMVANTEYELKHLKNEYATLETQRESALCALKEANLALEIKSKVEEQCAAYKAQLDSACSQIQELENQVKGVEKLKSEVNELKLEKAEDANSIATLNKNLDNFKARYTSIMNEHQTVLKEKMEIGTQLAEAEYKLSGLQEKLISLENRHGQQVKENKELLAELQSLKAAVKDLESRAPVSQPNFDVEWAHQENARLTNHSSHLSEKLDSAIKETENLRRMIKESSSEKDVLLKETDQLRLKLQELETARNTDHVKEELMEKLEESQKELEEANAKVVNLTAQVNSLEDFLKKNEKRVEFATFSEYKAVKHCLGAIGKTEVILLERCMKKMEKELELLKVQKKELESKVMKNASIAEHYKSKVIEYRNKYYIEVGQPEKVVSLTTLHQPQLNAIQEESREESGRESVAEMQPTSKIVIPIEETKAVEKPIVKTEQSVKKIKIGEDIVPSKPAPPNNSAVEGKTAETEVPRIPLGKVNSPRKNPPSMRLETVPGTSASSAGRLPEPKSEKPGKVQPPVRGRVTRSTTRKLGDEDMPDNCKQQ